MTTRRTGRSSGLFVLSEPSRSKQWQSNAKRRTPGCATNLQQRVLPRICTGVPFSSSVRKNLIGAAKLRRPSIADNFSRTLIYFLNQSRLFRFKVSKVIDMKRRAIVWFRQDLRLHDNEALTIAMRMAEEVIPVYIFDERVFKGQTRFGFKKTGPFRAKFYLESVEDLRRNLKSIGSDLVIRIVSRNANWRKLPTSSSVLGLFAIGSALTKRSWFKTRSKRNSGRSALS